MPGNLLSDAALGTVELFSGEAKHMEALDHCQAERQKRDGATKRPGRRSENERLFARPRMVKVLIV